ncbi:hypothetical protein [Archaeoglobus profundus]|uniref:Uncharacterized protein n=1 Tax=Archaeoglobus profundus (strain DSM 5631 / JCM 9629 / NBRC 100127 / Av18) TaxID=572546 RepID=D2RDR9_ARCPA|nr:hypothetical protein [Archaeoglobus profundus]ADB58263.1 hypothetical protein Arcpr_1211 [Archaeoglobus profundus DSM 5631]
MKDVNSEKVVAHESISVKSPVKSAKEKLLVLVIISLCGLYLFLATFPKHGDFWIMSYTAKCFAEGHYDFYNYITIF